MPDSTLSQAIKEAYASAPADVVTYDTIELSHPAFTQPIYVVNDWADLTATLETGAPVTFIRFAFRLVRPEVTPTGVPQLTLEIDNVSRDILVNVQAAMASTDKVTLRYRQYLSTDLSGPQNDPPLEMTITSIRADVFKVTATAGFGDVNNKRFPNREYTAEEWPGLVV